MNPSVYSLVKLFCICCWAFFCILPSPSKLYDDDDLEGDDLKAVHWYACLMLFFFVGGIISGAILFVYKPEG